jgi:hypothetical protein
MLDPSASTTSTPAREQVKVSGRELRRMLRGASPATRAEIAARLARGLLVLVDPLPSHIARMCSVNPGRLTAALGRRGSRGPHSKTLAKLVRRYGADTLLAAVDRATAPTGNGTRAHV